LRGASDLFRFLHAADIHLDSPLRGLARYEGAPVDEIRAAPRRAFENLIQFAIDEEVAFLLLAGDLYDGDWKDYNTGLFFVGQMRRLEQAGISVHLVSGNHDAVSQITKRLTLPENVTHYSDARPQTVELPELGVAIHGQSFKGRSVTLDLAADYPAGEPGRLDIGLLHTSLDGRPGHDDYAPTSVGVLASKGYDYWALGHVHQREVVSEDPWIVFPGNLQGRHARETGEKGATLITVSDGEILRVEHRCLDVVRWERIEIDLSSLEHIDEMPSLVERSVIAFQEAFQEDGAAALNPSLFAIRLALTGQCGFHSELIRDRDRWIQEIRSQLLSVSGADIFLEKVDIRTQAVVDFETVLERDDALGDLLRTISGLEDASVDLDDFIAPLREIRKKLPSDWVVSRDGFDPTDLAQLRELLPNVRSLLLSRLAGSEESV